MVSKWNVVGYPLPTSADVGADYLPRLLDGVQSAATDYAGAVDPSTGAPATWQSATYVGSKWLDTSDPSNPKLKRWQLLLAPGTYGWRTLRLFKTKWLVTPQALTLAGSPAGADIPYADYDFSTDLDDGGSGNVQDAGDQENALVVGVWLRCVVQTGAAETVGTGATKNAYMKWQTKGSTNEQRVRACVANHEEEATIFVPLDASEIAEWGIVVGGGTPAFAFSASILGFVEEV